MASHFTVIAGEEAGLFTFYKGNAGAPQAWWQKPEPTREHTFQSKTGLSPAIRPDRRHGASSAALEATQPCRLPPAPFSN